MPDRRQHRGPHPEDQTLFAVEHLPRMREAARDLSWLLSRGYASPSALKIVGDRYSLDARQRLAIGRCACSEESRAGRQQRETKPADVKNHELWIDGYNALTTIESALSGGVVLAARDGCYRDMASMHGTYRSVEETIPAIHLLGEVLASLNLELCRWLFDQPVSNSGRLKATLEEIAKEKIWNWKAELVPDPDPLLGRANEVVATSDSHILDQTNRWLNLARLAIDQKIRDAWIVDLATDP